jgi:hypothetical protein
MLIKALAWVSVSIGTPLWGNMEGPSFLRTFEIYRCIKRCVKMPWKLVSLHRGPVGEPGVDSLAETFWREKDSISEFLSWTRRTLRFYVWRPCGNLVKGQGYSELILDYGEQRPCL